MTLTTDNGQQTTDNGRKSAFGMYVIRMGVCCLLSTYGFGIAYHCVGLRDSRGVT